MIDERCPSHSPIPYKSDDIELRNNGAFLNATEPKKRIILKQIESGTRPNYDLIIKKIFIILGFISLSVLISFLILKN